MGHLGRKGSCSYGLYGAYTGLEKELGWLRGEVKAVAGISEKARAREERERKGLTGGEVPVQRRDGAGGEGVRKA